MCVWRVTINTIYPLSGERERIQLCSAGQLEQNNVNCILLLFFNSPSCP